MTPLEIGFVVFAVAEGMVLTAAWTLLIAVWYEDRDTGYASARDIFAPAILPTLGTILGLVLLYIIIWGG